MNQITVSEKASALELDRRAAESLAHTSGLQIEEQLTSEFDFRGYIITNQISSQALEELHEGLTAAMAPADEDTIFKALAVLYQMTSHRTDSDADLDVRMNGYVQKLHQYPKAAVLERIEKLADTEEWWPSWAKMREDVEFRCQHGLALLKAVERKQYENCQRDIRRYTQIAGSQPA